MPECFLELKDVSKTFTLESGRELKVLENINLSILENQVIALLGPSGSGKSTCLRIMCGLQGATSGAVFANGAPLSGINSDVSLVFQSFALFPWESIFRNIEIALHPLNLSKDEMYERVKRAIDIVGLEGFEEAYPRELSGGMKQRVGVARALAMQRPILFLDEPFSALDVLTADTLRDEIMKIFVSQKTKTRSMVVVTHNIQEAVLMADRILVMGSNPGHIRAEFTNKLPYPRNQDLPPFQDLVEKIHAVITETFMPDTPATQTGRASRQPRCEVLPDVQLIDVIGLVEAIHYDGGTADIFELAVEIGKDFGQTLYLVKAAELLNLVDTPRQDVVLTRLGRNFAIADVNERKKILHDNFAKLLITQQTTQLLKQSEIIRVPLEELTAKVHEWLPNEDSERIVNVLISWGRFAEYLGYNDNTKTVYLDVGQEAQ